MPKNVVIVGPPRSGTSLTAGIFARHGYFVAPNLDEDLRSADDANPFGYWEAEQIVESNVEILRRAGFRDHNTWHFDPITAEQIARIAALEPDARHRALVQGFTAHSPWMWKDPRLCFTLDYWWKLLGVETTVVLLATRQLQSVYQSFLRLGWCDTSAAARLSVIARVRQHLDAASAAVKRLGIPYEVIDYDDYTRDAENVARRISTLTGVRLTAGDLNVRRELNHDRVRARLAVWVATRVGRLSPKYVKLLKSMIPRGILRILFPERFVGPPRTDAERERPG